MNSTPPIHVLFIAGWYPHPGQPALGEFVRRHAQAAALHVRVSVVYAYSAPEQEQTQVDVQAQDQVTEIRVCFPKTTTRIPGLAQVKKVKRYQQAMMLGVEVAIKRNGNVDLLHVHVIFPPALALAQIQQRINAPLVITEHWSGYLPEDGHYKGIALKRFTQQAIRQAKKITVVSQRMEQAMRAHGLQGSYQILPNVVDTDLFQPAPNKAHHGLKLIHVSMLVDREKNISGLLRVMERVHDLPHVSLELIGGYPDDVAAWQARSKHLSNVHFAGLRDAAGVAAALQQADALVMFSFFEGMPVSIIEAQSCGLPVLASRVGHIPHMVDETQGLLVASGDEAALEAAIRSMYSNPNAFNRTAIRERAVETYSMRVVGQHLYDLYTTILGAKS